MGILSGKRYKAEIAALGPSKDNRQVERYKTEQQSIKEIAEDFQKKSQVYLDKHIILARAVTMFQLPLLYRLSPS